MVKKMKLNIGCGLDVPVGWCNIDCSPRLWIPFNRFPTGVKYGNIAKGLRDVRDDSCEAVLCSHVLEHMSNEDCQQSLLNIYRYLKPGGVLRVLLPDLRKMAKDYLDSPNFLAADTFIRATHLAMGIKTSNLKLLLTRHTRHWWMYDIASFMVELEYADFREVRVARFGDNPMFNGVERKVRHEGSFCLECVK